MRANKKLIRQQLTQESGKIVLLKDISNIASQAKKRKYRNDLTAVVEDLIEQYGKCIYTEWFNIFLFFTCIFCTGKGLKYLYVLYTIMYMYIPVPMVILDYLDDEEVDFTDKEIDNMSPPRTKDVPLHTKY